MKREEITKMIEHHVGERAAVHYGIILEKMYDQFAIVNEGIQMMRESMEREFKEIRTDINRNSKNIDVNSLDILDHENRIKNLEHVNKTYA